MNNRFEVLSGEETDEDEFGDDTVVATKSKQEDKVVPVFKKGDPKIADNYRPISICLDLSKAFDTINHGILVHKLEGCGVRGTHTSSSTHA
ncbi:hypothetical protein J6590_061913 [Homalodisca vitripennis]|nr:hypothetical protein J6590_061913 [Homalodisca vitripennis]